MPQLTPWATNQYADIGSAIELIGSKEKVNELIKSNEIWIDPIMPAMPGCKFRAVYGRFYCIDDEVEYSDKVRVP